MFFHKTDDWDEMNEMGHQKRWDDNFRDGMTKRSGEKRWDGEMGCRKLGWFGELG